MENYMENARIVFEEKLKNNPYLKKIHDKNMAYRSNLENLISEMNKELGVTITNSVGHDDMFHLKVAEFRDENGVVFFKCQACSLWEDNQDWEEEMIFKATFRYKDIYLKNDNLNKN